MPQSSTPKGSCAPLERRSSDNVLPAGWFEYSIHSRSSRGEPDPRLPAKYGSAPTAFANAMNSCVPKEFGSGAIPQWVLTRDGRCARGPIPSRQLYSSAKQPPGHRSTGISNGRRASTTSVRMPSTLGTALSGPTQMPG